MPKKLKATQTGLSTKIVSVLVAYVRTQLLLILIVTLLTWIMLAKLGVSYALLLALITGAASVVPVIGITVAAVISCFVAIFDPIRFLPQMSVVIEGFVIIFMYGILNIVVDYFLSPYLVGKSVGVHPVLLLIILVVGTAAFGVYGALLSVPAVLVAKTVVEHHRSSRRS